MLDSDKKIVSLWVCGVCGGGCEVERPNNGGMAIQRERFEQDPLGSYKVCHFRLLSRE